MTARKEKKRCPSCGGFCGRKVGQGCQYANNEARRRGNEMWETLTAHLRERKGRHD